MGTFFARMFTMFSGVAASGGSAIISHGGSLIGIGVMVTALTLIAPTLPTEMVSAIATLFSIFYLFDFLIPVDTVFDVLTYAMVVWTAVFVWDSHNWLIAKTNKG